MLYVLYTKEDCVYCKKAKELLAEKGLKTLQFNIDEDFDALEWFVEQGYKTVPQIFKIQGETRTHIGGYTELEALLQ